MTHTAQMLTDRPLRSGPSAFVRAVTAAVARVRTHRQAPKATAQPVPFNPELHVMPPFALLVSGLR